MDTEMSSQPHLLICCYLLSSRQYLVQGTHNAEVSTTFITLIPGHTTHAATDQQKQSGLEDLQSSPSLFGLCTNFPWLRCCSSGKEPRHGYVPVRGVPETGGCRDLLWEWPSFPSGGYNPVLVSSKACQNHPCTPCSLGGLHSTPCVIPLVRLVVDADEALSRIRHLWKSILKSCHTVTVGSHEANAQLSKSMSQGNQ